MMRENPARISVLLVILASCFISSCSSDDPDPNQPQVHNAVYGVWGDATTVYFAGARDDGKVVPVVYSLRDSVWSEMPINLGTFEQLCQSDPACSHGAGTNLRGIVGVSGGDVYAFGAWHQIFKLNGGAWEHDWSGLEAPQLDNEPDVSFWSGHIIGQQHYVLSASGIVVLGDHGWNPLNTPTASDIRGIWGNADDNIYLSSGTSLYRFNGAGWDSLEIGLDAELGTVVGKSSDELFVATWGSAIVRFNGTQCDTVLQETEGWRFLLTTLEDGEVVALGSNSRTSRGRVWIESRNWELAWDLEGVIVQDIWGRSLTDIYVVGHSSDLSPMTAFVYHYNGAEWARVRTAVDKETRSSDRYGVTVP